MTATCPLSPAGAVVSIGPAIDVAPLLAEKGPRHGPDPFMQRIAAGIQALLDQHLVQGPPPDWHCPPPIEEKPHKQPPTLPEITPAPAIPEG